MLSKIVKYTFILLFLSYPITSLSQTDIQTVINEYNLKSKNYDEDLQGLTPEFFMLWGKTTMMNRVKNIKRIIGAGTGGFVFLADYLPPHSIDGKYIPAAVKILPEGNPNFISFNENVIQAVLSGNKSEDKYNPGTIRPFSYDKSEGRIEINNDGETNPYKDGVCKFYEMQKATIKYQSKLNKEIKFYETTLITDVGVSDMHRALFTSIDNREENTATFLRYMVEFVLGGRNINKQGILHGDIKPKNVILVEGSDGLLHVEHIDFDLILDHRDDLIDRQLRYTKDFRAPWIKGFFLNVEKDIHKEPRYKQFYKFDENYKEDTYALGKSILKMIKLNEYYLLPVDNTILKLSNYIRTNIIVAAYNGPSSLPTTEQFYTYISDLVSHRGEEQVETLEISTAQNNFNIPLQKTPIKSLNQMQGFQRKVSQYAPMSRPQFLEKPSDQILQNLFKRQVSNLPSQVSRPQIQLVQVDQSKYNPVRMKKGKNVDFDEKNKLALQRLEFEIQRKIQGKTPSI